MAQGWRFSRQTRRAGSILEAKLAAEDAREKRNAPGRSTETRFGQRTRAPGKRCVVIAFIVAGLLTAAARA